MENTRTTQHGEGSEQSPALPYEAWRETCQTLHLWTQIVGKVRMALSPFLNHWWHPQPGAEAATMKSER